MIGPSNRSLSPRTHSPIIRRSVFGGPPGFPRHYLGGVHNPDVLAIEHANMLLSAVCT